jgi:hypothetical protein
MDKKDYELMKAMGLTNPAALGAFLKGDLANALVAATPGGIEAQEAAAQREFQCEQKLPKEGTIEPRNGYGPIYRTQMEAIGFRFGDEIDNLFIACHLPNGWEIKPTEHSMWSYIQDGQGRERMQIFYKGAFYDRHANLSVKQRYEVKEWYAASPAEPSVYKSGTTPKEWLAEQRCTTVQDYDGTVMHFTATYTNEVRDASDKAYHACEAWLFEHYPLWRDPFEYWDETQKDES